VRRIKNFENSEQRDRCYTRPMRTSVATSIAFVTLVLACGGTSAPPAAPAGETVAPVASSTSTAPASTASTAASTETTAAPSTSATTAPPPAVEQTIPLVAFQMVSTEGKGEVLYDVKADGEILDKSGAKIGTSDGHVIKFDQDIVFTVDKDGTVHGPLLQGTDAKFDAKDALVAKAGKLTMTASVDDKGAIHMVGTKGKDDPPWKVVGPIAAARRMATMLSMTIARAKKK
jgi:hypothetical protein